MKTSFEKTGSIKLPTQYGVFTMIVYKEKETKKEHFILIKGEIGSQIPIVRVHFIMLCS